jgi:hypothetical protein
LGQIEFGRKMRTSDSTIESQAVRFDQLAAEINSAIFVVMRWLIQEDPGSLPAPWPGTIQVVTDSSFLNGRLESIQ